METRTTPLADLEVTVGANAGLERTFDVGLQITADVGLQQYSIRN